MTRTILHIAPTPFFADRGCHIRIEGIVRCLDQLGFANTVCTYHHGRDVSNVTTRRISPIKNYTQTAAGPSKYKLWADWKLLWLCVKEFNRLKPVAIHAHLHEGIVIGVLLKLLFFWRRVPLVADMQGSLTGELSTHGVFKKLPFLRWPTWILERILMWFPTAIVCSSRHSLEKLQAEFNIPDKKISLAQDGANPIAPIDTEQQIKLRARFGLPANTHIVIYSGALLASKGLEELKRLLLASANVEQIHFLIVGYPTENLAPFLAEHKLTDKCTMTGQVAFEKLGDFLQCSDIAIDPKNTDAGEGSGKMLNYLAAGLPVIAFATANNREFLPAQVALANDDEALANNLLALTENKALRQQQSEAARDHFAQNYSWSVTQDQLAAVYRALGQLNN